MSDISAPAAIPAVRSPSQLDAFRRLVTLTWTLAITDWKLRFYGSVLGFAWTLVRPFALFGVIYVVFTQIVGLDKDVLNYGVYILFALVLFTFFAEASGGCVQALVMRENLLRKMQFNPVVIPLSIGVTAMLNLGATLVAVLGFALANGVFPTWAWLELPIIILLLAMLATGLGMLLSVLYLRYRDVQPIWDVFSQILFYGSPLLYVATAVPAEYRGGFLLNPIAALITEMRHAVIDPTAPSITTLLGSPGLVVIPLGLIFGIFWLGIWFFQGQSPRIAENL